MQNLENKKYSVMLLLACFFGIILCAIVSHEYYYVDGELIPLYEIEGYDLERVKVIDFGFFQIRLQTISFFMVFVIARATYLFLYKTDEEIKKSLVELKNRINAKYLKSIALLNAKKSNLQVEKKSKGLVPSGVFIIGIILIAYFSISYYMSISDKEKAHVPLTLFEAFYSSFLFNGLILGLLAFLFSIVGLSKKTNGK